MLQRTQKQLIANNEKLKELQTMRLYLKICEINSNSLSFKTIDTIFTDHIFASTVLDDLNKNNSSSSKQQQQQQHHSLQAASFKDLIKSLYGYEAFTTGFVYQFFVIFRYICSSLDLFQIFKAIFRI